MRQTLSLLAGVLVLAAATIGALARDDAAKPDAENGSPPAAESPAGSKRVLTPEDAEKEARKECKKICDIIATRAPEGDDISCDIVKTWREEYIVKMLGGRINWPWGKAVCQSKLELKRGPLALAMSESQYDIALEPQKVRCTLAQRAEGDPYTIELTLAPKVKFENGKAVEANINWGEASAPMFVYPLIYAGTGLDNSTNVLGPEVVRMVNEFTTKKCAEVKCRSARLHQAKLTLVPALGARRERLKVISVILRAYSAAAHGQHGTPNT